MCVQGASGDHCCRRGRSVSRPRWPEPMGCARSWVYELVARYRAEGDAAFDRGRGGRSARRPRSPTSTVDADRRAPPASSSAQGLDAGPETIAWHLEHHHQIRGRRGRRSTVPAPPRPRHPRAAQAAHVLLHPVRGRAAERVLAVRLHPLAARRRHRHRDLVLARRPLPLRPVRHRPRAESPARSSSTPSAPRSPCTASPHRR